jgi:hypothetical protein
MGCLLFLGLDWESFGSADSLYLVTQLIGYLALASVALVLLNGITLPERKKRENPI